MLTTSHCLIEAGVLIINESELLLIVFAVDKQQHHAH
jgi:hypothetical protein